MPAVRRVAGDLLGGETLEHAWAVAERLRALGLSCTLGFWDTPAYSAAEVQDIYLATIARSAPCGPDAYVSIKPPALRFDAAAARRLGQAAASADIRLHCDSHGVHVAEATFAFIESLLDVLPPHLVSVSMPGRWARSPADAERMLARGVGVRIVKGEWPDPEDPARDLREGFLALVDRVVGAGPGVVALATHDLALATEAAGRLSAAGGRFELESIYGLQTQRWLDLARGLEAPARIYVPYGKGFAPNALRVVRRHPALMFRVLRSLLAPRL